MVQGPSRRLYGDGDDGYGEDLMDDSQMFGHQDEEDEDRPQEDDLYEGDEDGDDEGDLGYDEYDEEIDEDTLEAEDYVDEEGNEFTVDNSQLKASKIIEPPDASTSLLVPPYEIIS